MKSRTRRAAAKLGTLAAAGLLAGAAGSALAAGTDDQSASGGQTMQSSENMQHPSGSMQSSESAQGSRSSQNQTLDQLAQQEGQVSEFVKALEKAGMANALTKPGTKYTIFAPTNDALKSSGENIQTLMQPGHQQELVKLLRAHIVADDVSPEMAERIGKAKTIGGGSVDLESQNGKLQVGDAKVVASNVQQGNLRLYAIDNVLQTGEFAAFENQSGGSDQSQSNMSESHGGMDQNQGSMHQGDMHRNGSSSGSASGSEDNSDWNQGSSQPQ